MKIAILADALDLQSAGIQVYLRGLVEALARVGAGHDFLLVRPKTPSGLIGMKEITVPIKKRIPGHQRLRAFVQIPKILKQEQVEIVIEPAHFGPFNLPRSIKRVNIVHDLTPILFPKFHPLGSQLFHRFWFPQILHRSDLIIANSAYTRQDIETQFPKTKNKIEVILPSADSLFRPTYAEAVLKKYGITRPYIIYVGTLEPRKNLATLLSAFERLKQEGVLPHQLVLIGRIGWQIQSLLESLNKSDFQESIIQTGFVPKAELPILYSMAETFVYPSFYEGFGLPVVEAMACGTVCLVSNTSSLPEVGGGAAFYFNPNSVEELVQQLKKILLDKGLLKKHEELSLQQAARFDWDRSARQLLTILCRKFDKGSAF